MARKPLFELVVGIKGAGEMASAVAWRLHMAGIRRIFMMETKSPAAVRRMVSFCEAVYTGTQTVERVTAVKVDDRSSLEQAWKDGWIGVAVDPEWSLIDKMAPDVVVDAILAKKNLGTTLDEVSLVIGLGPGFRAGGDVHLVVETRRGHHLGRIIEAGRAAKNTGVPGSIAGYTHERVLRAPVAGCFNAACDIMDRIRRDEVVGTVGQAPVMAAVDGVIRGLIRSGSDVKQGTKLGDIDPRGKQEYCRTISDKARAIAGSVLEGVLRRYNRPRV